jgi:anti-sigma factor RsiW
MSGDSSIGEDDLHAFIDGALGEDRRRQVEAAMRADAGLADRAAAFARDKQMMKRLYGPSADRPLPARWIALARGAAAPPAARRQWRRLAAIAAVLLLALAGAIAYWQHGLQAQGGGIVQAALDARTHRLHGETAITVAGPDIRSYDAVLRNVVAMKVKVPDLRRMGYRLTGIHFYPQSPRGRAAELLYRDGQGRLFTLYLRRSDGAARFDQFERDGLRVCIWQDDALAMVMAGNVSTAAMQRLASLSYTGLTL